MRLHSEAVESLAGAWCTERGVSRRTWWGLRSDLRVFARWADEAKGEGWDWREAKPDDGTAFLLWLIEQGYAENTRAGIARAIRRVYAMLYRRKLILTQPFKDLRVIETVTAVRDCLSEEDMARFLESIEPEGWEGLRDRALFELMYSSGLRPGEITRLRGEHVEIGERTAIIEHSKFDKTRLVAVTERAMVYLRELMSREDPKVFLFSSRPDRRGNVEWVGTRFARYTREAGVWRPGLTAHSVRHSCAKHLLAHGADLRYVQELLGHESIETTVVYTQELTENVKKWHRRFHPREQVLWQEVDETYRRRIEGLIDRIHDVRSRRRPSDLTSARNHSGLRGD